MQTQEGEKAEAYLKKGVLELMPEHADALADLAVALAMQGDEDILKVQEAIGLIERAENLGAAGDSFDKRRWVWCGTIDIILYQVVRTIM